MSTQSEFSKEQEKTRLIIPIDEKLIPPFVDGIDPAVLELPIKLVYDGYLFSVHPYPGMAIGQLVKPFVDYVGHGFWFGAEIEITEDNLGADLKFGQPGFNPPLVGQEVALDFIVEHKDGSKTRSLKRVYKIIL